MERRALFRREPGHQTRFRPPWQRQPGEQRQGFFGFSRRVPHVALLTYLAIAGRYALDVAAIPVKTAQPPHQEHGAQTPLFPEAPRRGDDRTGELDGENPPPPETQGKFVVLHQRQFGESALSQEQIAPDENSLVAESDSRQPHPQVGKARAKGHQGMSVVKTELQAAPQRPVRRGLFDVPQGVRRDSAVGVKEEKRISKGFTGPGVALGPSPPGGLQQAGVSGQCVSRQFSGTVRAAAVRQDNFTSSVQAAKLRQQVHDSVFFVVQRNDNRDHFTKFYEAAVAPPQLDPCPAVQA